MASLAELREWTTTYAHQWTDAPIDPTEVLGLIEGVEAARRLVDEQAEDDGLWFNAQSATEAYLQQELRRLHALIEAVADA